MNFNKRVVAIVGFVLLVLNLTSQSFKTQKNLQIENEVAINGIHIKWRPPYSFVKKGATINVLSFDGCAYIEEKNFLPYISLKEACTRGVKMRAVIQAINTETLSPQEEASVNKKYLTSNFEVIDEVIKTYRRTAFVCYKLIPLRLNSQTGNIEKLTSYTIQWQATSESLPTTLRKSFIGNRTQGFASSSVLGTGA